MKQILKKIFLGNLDEGDRKIKYGLASGLKMSIDPQTKAQRLLGLDERELFDAFSHHSRNASVFIDVGASDGYYGLVYKKLHPTGEVYMFDGGSVFLKEQLHNFELNNFEIAGQEAVMVGASDDNHYISLDTYVSKKSIKGTFFIKIDVEGGELNVLEGSKEMLHHSSCSLLIETHSAELERQCAAFLEALGYRTTIINNAWWRSIIPESRSIPHNRWLSAEK